MLNKDIPNIKSSQYLASAAIGGIIGFIIAILYKLSTSTIIVVTILGIVAGVVIDRLMVHNKTYSGDNADSDKKMQLREEQMKISKNKRKTGEVSIHKEVLTEEKNIAIPVKREELVIEKTVFDSQSDNKSDAHTETIRIPISEERIDIHKQPVALEEVSVGKHQYEEVKEITETLKKEMPHINIKGDAKIVDKEMDKKHPN